MGSNCLMCHVRNISNSNMAPRLSEQTSYLWCCFFFVSKYLLGIERQKRIKKWSKIFKNGNFDPKASEPCWNIDILHVTYGFTLDESPSTLCCGWGGVCKRAECPKTFDQDCSSLVEAFRKINNPVHFTLSYVTPVNSVFVVQSILFFFQLRLCSFAHQVRQNVQKRGHFALCSSNCRPLQKVFGFHGEFILPCQLMLGFVVFQRKLAQRIDP